ncbi:MAG: TRAP transporter large permease subunit, partial [Pseudomonadota bacterium]
MDVLTILDLLMFATACVFLLAGFPVAFTLAGTALIFMALGILLGGLSPSDLSALPSRIFGIMTNEVLIAAPLFIFMGVVLERSRVAEELLDEMGALFGSIRGGMGYSVLFVGTLMAASTGIVGATVVTMGLISLPAMLRRGYDPQLSTGLISAAGTLGQIIPPSIILILLSDVISNAYQKAQLEAGNFSPEPLSVGDLFAGALIPGLGLVALYAGYITLMGVLRPETCPPVNDQQAISPGERLIRVAGTLAPPILLIVSVLGSILAGITTPTEAAAVGAIGAVLIAGFRLCRKAETGPSTLPIIAAGLALIGLLALQGMFDLRLGRETVAGADQAA